jgi:hypothetical protein
MPRHFGGVANEAQRSVAVFSPKRRLLRKKTLAVTCLSASLTFNYHLINFLVHCVLVGELKTPANYAGAIFYGDVDILDWFIRVRGCPA